MVEERTSQNDFYSDDHAALFGLIAKHSEQLLGDRGLATCARGVVYMARERGLRSAKRCIANNEELTMQNYFCYAEILDSRGWNKTEINALKPMYQTSTTRCAWFDTWKKYGLEKYSQTYCAGIDQGVLCGFNPDLRLEMDKILADGDDCCSFKWVNCSFDSKAEFDAIMEKRKRMLPAVTRNFLYQAGHLLATLQRTLYLEHGLVAGNTIIDNSLAEYAKIFSREKADLINEEAKKNFMLA